MARRPRSGRYCCCTRAMPKRPLQVSPRSNSRHLRRDDRTQVSRARGHRAAQASGARRPPSVNHATASSQE
jgi:hypothetical protein